ncbi:MAG: hypothetical protein DWP94_12040 [Flavobacterium sp.]|nr:MAG: hypothetical protein DWP94_12040 [Flavobacterium sp.]
MTTINQKYYYAVVKKGTSRLLKLDGFLPIFLTKTMAKRLTVDYPNTEIIKINSDLMTNILRETT